MKLPASTSLIFHVLCVTPVFSIFIYSPTIKFWRLVAKSSGNSLKRLRICATPRANISKRVCLCQNPKNGVPRIEF
ncbi:hypothetical protein ACRRTK_005774 [Alexandromys fortis]